MRTVMETGLETVPAIQMTPGAGAEVPVVDI